jgi:hypothetical protein
MKESATMAKLSATLETAVGFSILPKDTYPAHIHNVEVKTIADTGATMLAVQWKPEGDKVGGEFRGTVFDNVMVSGMSRKGEPLGTQRLCDYISALGVEWDCKSCGKSSTSKFKVERGQYFCPNCGKSANFDFDPDSWQGKRALIQVDVGKDNKGEDRNEVGKVRALA